MKISDNALLFREFNKYTELLTVEKELPTEDDVDFFLDQFLTRNYSFYFMGTAILCANTEDPETGEKPYDMEDKSTKEALKELKPILMQKVRDAYGSISQESNVFNWDAEPRTVAQYARLMAYDEGVDTKKWEEMSESDKEVHPLKAKAQTRANKIRSRIQQYNEKVLPFMLRKTMHHPIGIIRFSQANGPLEPRRKDEFDNPVALNSEEDLQDFMAGKTYRETNFPGGKDAGLRGLLWAPSTTNRDLKMGIIDIDNPAKLPKEEVRNVTKQVALKLEQQGHPYIIMFTGNNFQVWFGQNQVLPLGDKRDVQDYITQLVFGLGAFDRQQAIDKEMVHFDRIPESTRMFFSLHYPIGPDSTKRHTGLAAVPVPIDDILTFDPVLHAHPENVLQHFDLYASVVSTFFDTVRIGQDYESEDDLESTPPCERLEGQYPDSELLSHIDDTTNSIVVELDDIAKKVADEKEAYIYAKARGVDAVLKFDDKGGLKFGSTSLSAEKTRMVGGKKTVSVEQSMSALITKTGFVVYDDYISRDLERFCQASNIRELTLTGQLVSYDYAGVELEESEIQGIIVRKEGIDPDDFRSLRFIVNKIASYNYDPVPNQVMLEEVTKIGGSRLLSGPNKFFTSPMGSKVKKWYQSIRNLRRGNRVVVMGEEKYLISSKKTIAMTILGVSKTTRLFQQDSPELGSVFVGLMKKDRNRGPIYSIAAKAQIALKKEDRIKLKELVYGENFSNRVPTAVRNDDFSELIEIVEPTVVVDVTYDDVGARMTHALPFHFLPQSNRGSVYRALGIEQYITKINGAKIVKIREDLDARREPDISFKQDNLIKIQGTAPKSGFSIVQTLPNPVKKDDMYDTFDKPLGEELDDKAPWKMSEKAFNKFARLAKDEALIGYVDKKRIYYNDADDWVILGNNDDFFYCPITFRSITDDFKLRGVDIINATKMCAEYGIKWHLIIAKGKFYWIYCDIENDEVRKEHDKYLADDSYDGPVEELLLDLMDTVVTMYPPKEVVKDATVPGFKLDILQMEKVKKNPAFHGVPTNLDSWTDVYIDMEPIPEGGEPRNVVTKYGVVPVHSYHGRKVSPPLIDGTAKVPGELDAAYKRWEKGEDGYKVFIDKNSKITSGPTSYYRITGLPPSYQTAVDDPYGQGADAVNVASGTDEIKSYKEQLDLQRLSNKQQALQDAKILGDMFNYIPGEPSDPDQKDTETYRSSGLSQQYKDAVDDDNKNLKKVLQGGEMFKHFGDATRAVGLKNPPIKEQAWAEYVGRYIETHSKWEKELEPKESWERRSIGEFPTHLVPMLEKERLLAMYRAEQSLTEDELRIVNETFSGEIQGDLLESTIGDLFTQIEEDEEEIEFEPDDDDFEIE